MFCVDRGIPLGTPAGARFPAGILKGPVPAAESTSPSLGIGLSLVVGDDFAAGQRKSSEVPENRDPGLKGKGGRAVAGPV